MTTHRVRTRWRPAGAADPEEVAERVIRILNDGAICLLASLGHELGLFETLAALPPGDAAPRWPTQPASTSVTCASGSAAW